MSGKIVGGGSVGGRKSYNGIADIPSGSRKMVQSLKEIVNCPEAEIYAVLKDCNMDPNEAVNRLLSQDPFHEVKSKKEKKKEIRDIPDSRPRGYSNTYNRGTRGGSDRYAGPGRSGATSFSSNESRSFQGKTTNKRESEKQTLAGSFSSTPGVSSHHQIPHSDSIAVDSKTPTVSSSGGISSSQPVSLQQTAWFGAAGQMSMADIVKMGRPHNKTANSQKNVSEVNHEHEIAANQHVPVKDQWPSIEKPMAASTFSVSVAPTESEKCINPADFQSSKGDQHLKEHLDDTHIAENGPFGNLGRDHVQADTVAGGPIPEDEAGVSSEDDNPYRHETQNHPVEHRKDEDNVSSVAANLQELNIENHDKYSSHDEDKRAVLIPDHLLVYTEECSQLSFGSFGSRPLNNSLEEASDVAPQIERADARNTEFYGDEQLGSVSNGNMVHASTAENYDDSSEPQREVLLPENPETAHEKNQYSFSQSDQEYAYENAKQQMNTAFDASQTSMQNQMENLASLSNVMQGYTNSIPDTLLAQTAQSARELELQYSTFPGVQSMPSRSNDASLGGQSNSMPEALRDGGGIQTTQPSQQNLPGANIATGPALPQQLPVHPYSQHTVPLTHFANMISYPLMPQSYPYMPSAFQQAFAGNSSYPQSLAALLPQYKNNISASNFPQSATSPPISSAYGFGNSSNVGAGNFPLNHQQQQQATPTGATLSYEDVMSLQYKQNHLLSLQQQQQQQQQQQNENSPVWLHGPGSQTMSGVQSNAYYNLQAQQQAQQLRQAQQQAQQQYGSLGYPNYYQSQTGMPMEHQQQNPRESGSQGQPSKQTQQQQLWQNSY